MRVFTRQVNNMQNERIDNYRQSMESINYSDYEKERMVHRIMNGGTTNGGRMKGKLNIKKLAITFAACMTLFSATAFAAGKVAGIVSWNRIDTRTTDFEDLSKLEEKAGMDIAAVETFSNGYTFHNMEMEEERTQDADGNDLGQFKGISITYVKDGCPEIYLDMNQADMYKEPRDEARDMSVKEFDGITMYYNCDEYLNLPEGEEPTKEEMQRTETDKHFFISDGSDERYTDFVSVVDFEMDGIVYVVMGFDVDMTADELFDMAEEIIAAR